MLATILSAVLALTIGSADLQTAPAQKDTIDTYIINDKIVANFDGSELEGKTIKYYRVTREGGEKPMRVHLIITDDYAPANGKTIASSKLIIKERVATDEEVAELKNGSKSEVIVIGNTDVQTTGKDVKRISNENTLYLVNGKAISSEDFNKIDVQKIQSINVIKNPELIKQFTKDPKVEVVMKINTK
ncbi:MAG: hypothetical protein HUJ90_06295 [Bacteroidales bacterium]|nr:hypothetical protein [Bacteroidales bacterium]